MTTPRSSSARRKRIAFALTAAAAIALLCLLVATLHGGSAEAAGGKEGLERYDLVGEGHPTGGLRATLARAAFPDRTVMVTMPGGGSLSAAALHVIEDGSQVSGATVEPLGSAGRFRVRYVSLIPLGTHEVELSIKVDGVGIVDLDYPARGSAQAAAAPGHGQSFWHSPLGSAAVPSLAGLLIGLAFLLWLVPHRRRSGLLRRVGEFTSHNVPVDAAPIEPEEEEPRPSPLERLLARMTWWPRFKQDVEIGEFSRSATDMVLITAALTLVVAVLLGLAVGAMVVSLLVLPLGPLALHSVVRKRVRKQRALFADQLAQLLEELASAMRAGHGLVAGLTAVVRSAPEPSKGEWARVIADERLGLPLDVAMQSLAERMDSSEVEQVALIASLHSRTGGNIAEVLDRLSEAVRERAELRRELQALTAQARLSRWVVTLLPPGVLGVVELLNPSYLEPLFKTTTGNVVLAIAVTMLVTGSLVMRAMTEIKV